MSNINEESLEKYITDYLTEHPDLVHLAIQALSNSIFKLNKASYYIETADALNDLAELVEYTASESNITFLKN